MNENERVTFISSKRDSGMQIEITIFEPDQKVEGSPLVVINHGTSPGEDQHRERSINPTRFFLKMGMTVILPMRRGYSKSTGNRAKLKNCDLRTYGLENAYDIADTISWIEGQPQYGNKKIVLIGQSTGGLAVMAYSSLPTNTAAAIINFHGGMRPQYKEDCKWQARIDAFKSYAATSRPISLWFYTANDHSSNPEYIGRLYKEFVIGGGKADLVQLASFKQDGHYLFGDSDGAEFWQPKVKEYLNSLNLLPK